MADKATVPQVKAFFASGGSGKDVTNRDMIDLKKAEGVTHPTAYDDLAFGIGDGSLSY